MRRFLALVLVLVTSPVWAATYFVDFSAGSDANNGTSTATPWKTIPGTRNFDNTGYLNAAWGAVTTSAKIQCGDTILLKGDGDTYTAGGVRGHWRISADKLTTPTSPGYYSNTCTSVTPITIKIATNGEWTGSTGHFNIDATGINFDSVIFGDGLGSGHAGGVEGFIAIELLKWVRFSGLSSTQMIKLTNVLKQAAGSSCGVAVGEHNGLNPFPNARGITVGWMEMSNKSAFDSGGALCVNNTAVTALHDSFIHDWRGPGIWVGGGTAGNRGSVLSYNNIIQNNGPLPIDVGGGNPAWDGLAYQGSFNNTLGDGGGTWAINTTVIDGYANGSNFGGCTSQNIDTLVRYWNFRSVHNGRTPAPSSARTGFESSGDVASCAGSGNALPEHSGWHFRSLFYNNFGSQFGLPHGAGMMSIYNTLFVMPNGVSIIDDQSSAVKIIRGSIIESGASSHIPFQRGTPGGVEMANRFPIISGNNIYHGLSQSDSFTTGAGGNYGSFCTPDGGASFPGFRACRPWFIGDAAGGGQCLSNESCRMQPHPALAPSPVTYAAPPGFVVGTGDRVGTGVTFNPLFTAAPASCTGTNFDDRNFNACDFTPQATSPSIDSGVFVLKAVGAGSGSTTLTVEPADREPYQVGAAYLNWAGSVRPHASEPWTYFTPQSHWLGLTIDDTNIGQFGGSATCTNALADLGDARRFRVVSMTATTITLDRTCTWADDQLISNQRFVGAAPEAGGVERDAATSGTSTTSTTINSTTSTISSTSSTSTTSITTTSSTVASTTTSTTLQTPQFHIEGTFVIEGRYTVD